MKLIILAALAAATPALAQTTNSPPQQGTAADPSMAAPQATTDPAMPMPATPAADPSAATPPAAAPADPAVASSAPMPATGPYPMCSKTVTDHCKERHSLK